MSAAVATTSAATGRSFRHDVAWTCSPGVIANANAAKYAHDPASTRNSTPAISIRTSWWRKATHQVSISSNPAGNVAWLSGPISRVKRPARTHYAIFGRWYDSASPA